MQIFARVVEARSFSRAARELRLSKSVVSKHVARLEAALGVQLLNRTPRCVSVTEIGREFAERCAEMIAVAEQAEAEAMEMQSSPRGTVRVTIPVSLGMLYVAPALPRLLEAYPDLTVEVTLSNGAVSVIDDGFDLAVVVASRMQPAVIARRIATAERRLCAAPSYLSKRGTPGTAAELRSHSCLIFSAAETPRKWHLHGPEGPASVTVAGNLVFNNQGAIREAALQGGGIALLPTYLVGTDLQRGNLVSVLQHYRPDDAAIYAVFPSNRHISGKVRAFVDFLVQRFRDDSARSHAPDVAEHGGALSPQRSA